MIRVISFLVVLAFLLFFRCTQAYLYADVSSQLKQAQSYYENSNYQDAVIIYQNIIKQSIDPNDTIEAQKGLVMMHIACGKQTEAETAYQQLLSNFPHNTHMADVIHHGIACCYRKFNNTDKANELDKFVLQNWPTSESAMWAQVDIVKSAIDSNDYSTAQAGIDNLFAAYTSNIHLGDAIHSIAYSFRQSQNIAKADDLDKYVVNHYSKTEGAMWAQVDIINSNIDGKDYSAAQTGIDNLLARFYNNENMAKTLHVMAYKYRQALETAKADELDKYVLDHWPTDEIAIWAQVDVIKSDINDNNYTAALADANDLLTNFTNEEQLAFGVLAFQIADEYRELNQDEKSYQFYKKIVSTWPGHKHTLWSQTISVLANIQLGDIAATETAIGKLCTDFSSNPKFPNITIVIAKMLRERIEEFF
jgi:outer membrane protein assembly factor BamD (BamD/ComL family)